MVDRLSSIIDCLLDSAPDSRPSLQQRKPQRL